MLANFRTRLAKRCPLTTRLILLPLALLCILGFLVNTNVSFLSTTIDICFPKNNIVFLKTHKCAGSSIQNILMRYGDAQKLHFVLPSTGNYLGHPAPFSRTMIAKPLLRSYNILAHHTRLDYTEIQSVMPKDSVYITIIRNPVEVFESAYSYYALARYLGGSLHKFLEKVPFLSDKQLHKRIKSKFGSNQMLFDLGANPDIFSNDTLVKQYIDKLESWFHLVLIADRMDESLILLRHLMCWDIDDVVTFKLNARDPKFISSLNEREKQILLNVNHADSLLYDRFLERFETAIEEFGKDKMAEEISQLRQRTEMWYKSCVKSEVNEKPKTKPKYYINPKVLVFKAKEDVDNNTCNSMTLPELQYTEILRNRQQPKVVRKFSAELQRKRMERLNYLKSLKKVSPIRV